MSSNGGALGQTKKHKSNRENLQISCLLTAVQKRASAKEKEQESELPHIKGGSQVGNLSYELISKILLLLPAESLHRSSFVCKEWFNLINTSWFIDTQTRQSETVFIFLKSVSQRRPKTFSVEAKLGLPESSSIFPTGGPNTSYIDFVEVQGGKGKVIESNISGFKDILATCNGLILATCEQNGGLLVINPMTRKLFGVPQGTILRLPHEQSYGFVFSQLTDGYKVVHLFWDETRYTGCEILSLSTRSWRGVDGPSFGLFRSFGHQPVAAIGALHWLPASHNCSYLVSMGIDDEKFHTRNLPISSSMNDRLVEIGGFLSFVTHVELNKIEVWILKGLEGENWVKRHIIRSYRITDLVPISTLRGGRELVFRVYKQPYFYAYDIQNKLIRKVEMEGEALLHRGCYLPHLNTLATGESLRAL